jgi:hypothetical protein
VSLRHGRGGARIAGTRSPSASPVGSSSRHAYCSLCGQARIEIRASDVRAAEDALCSGRCSRAWHALVVLRTRESASERVAARRRSEYENQQPHEPPLSEVLLRRWRAGDWTVTPEDLFPHVQAEEADASRAGGGASCASSD